MEHEVETPTPDLEYVPESLRPGRVSSVRGEVGVYEEICLSNPNL